VGVRGEDGAGLMKVEPGRAPVLKESCSWMTVMDELVPEAAVVQ